MKTLFYPIMTILLLLTGAGFISVGGMLLGNPETYIWMLAGAAAYAALSLIPAIKKNTGVIRIFTHELTHTVVCLMFFRKIHSFNVSHEGGAVQHSGGGRGDIFITLAPYCLPIYTFAFAILRLLSSDSSLFVFDILIGLTLAFHIICYAKETSPRQTDIKRSGYLRSLLFIPTALFFNLSIILLTVSSNFGEAFITLFAKYAETLAGWWEAIF